MEGDFFEKLKSEIAIVSDLGDERVTAALLTYILGIARGINKGHKVTERPVAPKISHKKGVLSKRTDFVRSLVKEVVGLAPYERRLIELIRNGGDKRARKLAKKRLGTHKRAQAKIEEMTTVIAESKRH